MTVPATKRIQVPNHSLNLTEAHFDQMAAMIDNGEIDYVDPSLSAEEWHAEVDAIQWQMYRLLARLQTSRNHRRHLSRSQGTQGGNSYGNLQAASGAVRCTCGGKHFELDMCIDCGRIYDPSMDVADEA